MVQYWIRQSNIKNSGFTLTELVIVIIVLGVLAATAGPKLIGKSAFEDYTVRDQLISRLRLVQLQGMNADPSDGATTNACYWLVVKSTCFYHEHTEKTASSCNPPDDAVDCGDDNYNQYNSVSFSSGMLEQANYRFDIDGKLSPDSNINSKLIDLDTPAIIAITGESDLKVKIETEGYIHEG